MDSLKIMTLGEFREATKDVPDDAEMVMDEGGLEFYEIRVRTVLPPNGGYPHALWLEMGQPITMDKDLHRRIDEDHL